MQASANPPVRLLIPSDFKALYRFVSENPAAMELKKYLRQYFMHLLNPDAQVELTDNEKRVLLVGLEVLSRNQRDEEIKKTIHAIKQDIENNGVLFLAVIKDDQKQPFIDYINYYDQQAEPEQKPEGIRAGRAVSVLLMLTI